mmetsp:Transcript_39010/g.107419  ORF Transcript_39010/g.107419 Transcript_39010/m.107419 type:complete len:230 (-) Transcript_39010:271-960(-)
MDAHLKPGLHWHDACVHVRPAQRAVLLKPSLYTALRVLRVPRQLPQTSLLLNLTASLLCAPLLLFLVPALKCSNHQHPAPQLHQLALDIPDSLMKLFHVGLKVRVGSLGQWDSCDAGAPCPATGMSPKLVDECRLAFALSILAERRGVKARSQGHAGRRGHGVGFRNPSAHWATHSVGIIAQRFKGVRRWLVRCRHNAYEAVVPSFQRCRADTGPPRRLLGRSPFDANG